MAGLLEGFLPWLYSQSDTVKRNVKGLLSDPRAFAASMGQDFQTANQQRSQAIQGLLYPSVMQTPQDRQAAMGQMTEQAVNLMAPTVYHGSPHKFDKFDSSKIGTGEGAQAYGHGLYLAENPGVASSYKGDTLGYALDGQVYQGFTTSNSATAGDYAANALSRMRDDFPNDPSGMKRAAIKWLKEGGSPSELEAAKLLQKTKTFEPTGNLYKVDLPDSAVAKMLDYDKPLNQQAPEVRKALKDSGLLKQFKENLSDFSTPQTTRGAGKGSNLLDMLSHRMGGEDKAAQYLRSIGIPGVRYLDQGSREVGRGTSNYVVFSGGEDALSILERNGRGLLDR